MQTITAKRIKPLMVGHSCYIRIPKHYVNEGLVLKGQEYDITISMVESKIKKEGDRDGSKRDRESNV